MQLGYRAMCIPLQWLASKDKEERYTTRLMVYLFGLNNHILMCLFTLESCPDPTFFIFTFSTQKEPITPVFFLIDFGHLTGKYDLFTIALPSFQQLLICFEKTGYFPRFLPLLNP